MRRSRRASGRATDIERTGLSPEAGRCSCAYDGLGDDALAELIDEILLYTDDTWMSEDGSWR